MKDVVYITGHRNPDTDSICSALAYAEFKNKTGEYEAIPIRQGELNLETQFVLDYFGVEPPKLLTTMKPYVRELDYDSSYRVDKMIPVKRGWNIIQDNTLASLYVTDEEDRLIGVASLANLTHSFMDVRDDKIIGRSKTTIDNIIDVLMAQSVVIPQNPRPFSGKMMVFAMDSENDQVEHYIEENDIVITGDNSCIQKKLIEQGVSLLIITNGNGMGDDLIRLAENNNITVISTELDTFMAARILPMAVPVGYVMTKENLIYFRPSDSLNDVKKEMSKTRYRSYPVCDDRGVVLGSISRYHVMNNRRKKLILIDHNERNQSVRDIEEADIIEIVDHHRIANIATDSPIMFRAEPVGSSATIVSEMFFESGIRPSKKVAGLLCAAIISDTLLFRSPTTTYVDKRVLSRMSKLADLDVEDFAGKMFRAGTSLKGRDPKDLIDGDVKTFGIGDEKIRVGQVMTLDPEELEPIKDELVELMEAKIKENGETMFVLVLTDIFKENSELLVVGKHQEDVERVFGHRVENGTISAPGVLSRKKQVIPKLTKAILG